MHRVTTQFTYLEPMCSSRCTRLPSGSFIQNPEKKRTSKWNVKVNALFLRTRTQSCAKLTLRGARLNVIDLLSILPINGLHGSKWGTSSRGFFSSVSAAAAAHFIPISQTHWWSFLSGRCVRQSLKRLSAENCSPPLPPPLEPGRTIVAF